MYITEENFKELFKNSLGNQYERALAVFRAYGPKFSWNIMNIFAYAEIASIVEQTLERLEEHWKEYSETQSIPDPVVEIFIQICA